MLFSKVMLLICFMVLESNAILSLSKAACLHKDIYIGIVLSGIFQIRKLFYPFHESTILHVVHGTEKPWPTSTTII